ncbi:MAG: NAD(P)-binding domain-containing protein [Micropruina sp.]
MARIAMIGLGRMGSGMAGRLLAAGHELIVANRTPQRAAPLLERGGAARGQPGRGGRRCRRRRGHGQRRRGLGVGVAGRGRRAGRIAASRSVRGRVLAATAATGQAASPQVVRNLRRMVAGDHRDPTFSAVLRHKDTGYALRFAEQLEVGAALGSVALDGLEQLLTDGRGSLNESVLIEVARDRRPS